MLILSQKHDTINDTNARVAELVDAHDSKSCGEIHESSSLSLGTIIKNALFERFVIHFDLTPKGVVAKSNNII